MVPPIHGFEGGKAVREGGGEGTEQQKLQCTASRSGGAVLKAEEGRGGGREEEGGRIWQREKGEQGGGHGGEMRQLTGNFIGFLLKESLLLQRPLHRQWLNT